MNNGMNEMKYLFLLCVLPCFAYAQTCTPLAGPGIYYPESAGGGYVNAFCPTANNSKGFGTAELAAQCGQTCSTFGTQGCFPLSTTCRNINTEPDPSIWGNVLYLCDVYRIGPAPGPAIISQRAPISRLASGCLPGWTSDGATCRNDEAQAADADYRAAGFSVSRDARGNLVEVISQSGDRITVEKTDTLGRISEMTRADGTQERYSYYGQTTDVQTFTQISSRGENLVTTYEWLAPSRPKVIVTPDGTRWTFQYGLDGLATQVKVKTITGGPPGQLVTTPQPLGAKDVVSALPYPAILAKGASNQATQALPMIYRLAPLFGAALIQQKVGTLPSASVANVLQALFPMIPIPGALPFGHLAPLAAVCIPDDEEFKPKPVPKPGTPERDKMCDDYEVENQAWCYEHMISDAGMRSCFKQAELEKGRCKNGQSEPKFLRPSPR